MMERHNPGGTGPVKIGGDAGFELPKLPKLPGRSTMLFGVVLIVLLLVLGLSRSFFVYVHPNQWGIKEVKIGVNRGIQEDKYTAGYAFRFPFGMEKIHLFPRDVQVLELTAFPSKASPSRFFEKAAKIQTSDGFYVDVDVTILYKIYDPYALVTKVGPGRLYLDNGILPKAEPILKEAFGELTTEDFYNSPMRVVQAEKARELLDAELQPKGIQVDQVLVRYFVYSDEIQKNIEEKKLQDQLVFKNQAQAKAAMEEAQLKRISQEGEMKVKVTLEEGNAYKVKKDAERELYTRKKEAEADLLVELAEARRTELKNEAMQVVGADKMVAMSMAEVLAGLDTIIVPSGGESGLNPLDLEQVLALFGADVTEGEVGPTGALEAAREEISLTPTAVLPPAAEPPPPLPQATPNQPEAAVAGTAKEEVDQ